MAWAGECWAIEAELTPKTVRRTDGHHARAADPDRRLRLPGRRRPGARLAARHARVIYLCAPAAGPTVARASDALGTLGARIEIGRCRPAAALASPVRRQAPP